jgi:hypothetical protein
VHGFLELDAEGISSKAQASTFYDDEPLRYLMVTNIIGDGTPPGQAQRLFAQLHLTNAGEPTTYVEPHGDIAWRDGARARVR